VKSISAETLTLWLSDEDRTTYVLDVRTPEEHSAGSIPGATHAPGGQLVQATDQWVGVRNARIVLVDSEGVRAPVVASWLQQLGCEACVLEGGTAAKVSVPRATAPELPSLARLAAAELKRGLDAGAYAVIDLRSSMAFRKGHIPGSRWSIRSRVAEAARTMKAAVLVADEDDIARLAAIDLLEAGVNDVKLLDGGLAGWTAAGYTTEASEDVPSDSECIDYLFFVHDRHAGNREAMRQYLAWETGLIAQLENDDRALFKVRG
jgi:rhodanese-related sulfurtransferase